MCIRDRSCTGETSRDKREEARPEGTTRHSSTDDAPRAFSCGGRWSRRTHRRYVSWRCLLVLPPTCLGQTNDAPPRETENPSTPDVQKQKKNQHPSFGKKKGKKASSTWCARKEMRITYITRCMCTPPAEDDTLSVETKWTNRSWVDKTRMELSLIHI